MGTDRGLGKGSSHQRLQIRAVPPVHPRSAPVSGRDRDEQKLPLALSVGLDPDLKRALDHRIRRTILRGLLRVQGGVIVRAKEILPSDSLAQRSYHAHVLCDCDLVEIVLMSGDEGSELGLRFLGSEEPVIGPILAATEQWDVATN